MPYDVENIFKYHAPIPGQPAKYDAIRQAGKLMATVMLRSCPMSSELMLALRKVEEAAMWANAAVARNPGAEPAEGPPEESESSSEEVQVQELPLDGGLEGKTWKTECGACGRHSTKGCGSSECCGAVQFIVQDQFNLRPNGERTSEPKQDRPVVF